MMEHSFDIEFAQQHGIPAAIIYRNFQYWIAKNKANNKNFRDGRTWTYNSLRALADYFPYLSVWDIRQAVKALIDADILLTANYNRQGYDRTTWYAFVDEKVALKGLPAHLWNPHMDSNRDEKSPLKGLLAHLRNSQMDDANSANPFVDLTDGLCKSRRPISNPNPIMKTDNQTNRVGVSAQKRLELDLTIAQEKNFLAQQLTNILHPNTREVKTFANIVRHLVYECQAGRLPISIFKDVAKWARQAESSTAYNPKGLLVKKIKQETGFKPQERLLRKTTTVGKAAYEVVAKKR